MNQSVRTHRYTHRVPSKSTPAYKALVLNLNRARALSRIFDAGSLKPKPGDKRSGGRPSDEERELLRATVIYSIGALDDTSPT